MSTATRVGIMGGTFDPIHLGHLVTAEEALAQFGLERVIFMPTGTPVHKGAPPVAAAEDRYAMTVLATASNPSFEVSRIEVDRPGDTYTVDTLTELRAKRWPDAEIYFITGADAVWEIITWKDAPRAASMCRFIAATRPGYDLSRFSEVRLSDGSAPRVDFMEVPALSISSTDIRERVASGRPVRYLVPDAVYAYIRKHRLYTEATR